MLLKKSAISKPNIQEILVAMSTISYHDFCEIDKKWLKIGMMVFLKQKVKVNHFFVTILMGSIICELHNAILPEYPGIEAQAI